MLHTNGPVHQCLLNNSCTHHLWLRSCIPSLVPYIQKSQFSKVVTESNSKMDPWDAPAMQLANQCTDQWEHWPWERRKRSFWSWGEHRLQTASLQQQSRDQFWKDLIKVTLWASLTDQNAILKHSHLPLQWSWRYLLFFLLVCPLIPPASS